MQPARRTKTPQLPTLQSPLPSYSQRYEHMTKIANYNEMSQAQIWKQYEKLRICLKELNQEVLYHMEKKAANGLYTKEQPVGANVEAMMILLDEERKTNQGRLSIFVNQAASLQQRVQHLTNKTQYLADINSQIQITEAKIKQINLQNKDMRRRQKMVSKDLLSGPSFLQRLVLQQQALHYAKKKYQKYESIYKQSVAKTKQYTQKTSQHQHLLQTRISQYKQQQYFVAQQQNLQKFQQLQQIKANLQKYQTVYKRNYLMKLKQLETLVASIGKHDQVIGETEENIRVMRGEIDQISGVFAKGRRGSVSVLEKGNGKPKDKEGKEGKKEGRKSIVLDMSVQIGAEDKGQKIGTANDKNRASLNTSRI